MNIDWESRYQAGDMPWEKGAPSPGLIEFLRENPPPAGKILVPGCGWGHDVRALARTGGEVTGLDLAPSAIRGARAHPAVAGETYRQGDLFELPPDLRGVFDWVWEHTCFCAIDPSMRTRYVQSVSDALKPGGRFLAVFYINPDHDGNGPPFGVAPHELDGLFHGPFETVREWMPSGFYEGREGREKMRLLQKRG